MKFKGHKITSLYIRIPKTGSTTMVNVLQSNHEVAYQLKNKYLPTIKYCPNDPLSIGIAKRSMEVLGYTTYSELYVFSFVRNPFSRAVSSWKFTTKKSGKSFKDFCRNLVNMSNFGSFEEWHSTEQWIHLYDDENNLIVDYVGRVESYQQDFNIACDKIGIPKRELPHKNKSTHKHYTEYYDDETRQIVAEKYAKDIEYFGYKFGQVIHSKTYYNN